MIDVKQFIHDNYTEYTGDETFLAPMTKRNKELWAQCLQLLEEERQAGGVLNIDTENFAGILSCRPGYVDKDLELIVGFQSDAPLKRLVNPYGGMRMVEKSLAAYGYEIDEQMKDSFQKYRKTHNDAVFDVYTSDVRAARHSGLITGLPDAYGRGRIIGDYRRLALYGTDILIDEKVKDYEKLENKPFTDHIIRLREQISEQIRALKQIEQLAQMYGCDIRKPAQTAQEAIQAIYFGYLAGAKENNGAATSLGRTSTFIDIYIEKDLKAGRLTEEKAQELIDQFVMKLRFIRHLRTPEYDEMFGGDPTWVTEAIGGMTEDGKSLVTKTSFRFLHSLTNLGPAPEPNLTILWSKNLPQAFKRYCMKMTMETNAIQYENDDLMRPIYGDDYAIACCVSAMRVGKDMQYFGARCNLAKAVLYAINEGRDEISNRVIIDGIPKLPEGKLDFVLVYENLMKVLARVAETYVKANNSIHYMHDKYAYEASQMALHDFEVNRYMAFGIAGLSVAADSLSAIKYAEVIPIRNELGVAIDFITKGEFPKYGNDDDRVDEIAVELADSLYRNLRVHDLYNNATATLSVLTITSNVAYGKKTGNTPDGRRSGEAFAPGANPMHNREQNGALASLNSVSKLSYTYCRDGISNTFSIIPSALGRTEEDGVSNLILLLDGYFAKGGQHLNINVLLREALIEAYQYPERFPNLTIRISGYAVNFSKLSREHQREIIKRTFHEEV